MRIDTQLVRFSKDKFLLKDRWVLPVPFSEKTSTIEITLETPLLDPESELALATSGDFQIIDTLYSISDLEYRLKIRCLNLSQTDVISLNFKRIDANGVEKLVPVYLYPFAIPRLQWNAPDEELNIGEEKVFELTGSNLGQIEATNLWESAPGYDYRLRYSEDQLLLYLLPRQTGTLDVKIQVKSRKAMKQGEGKYLYDLPPLLHRFSVKSGRLAFITLDKTDIVAEEGIGKPIEIQIDKARFLPVKKTYRIENQQEPGGTLLGEIFTRSLLGNDRMLCWLRPYGYHRISEGYLYIKDGDEPKFITNFNLIEKASITKVSVLHDGSDWSENLNFYPGERVDIRIEGNGLLRSVLNLEGIEDFVRDSTVATDQVMVFKTRIPTDFNKRKIRLLLNKKVSGVEFLIREFQLPRELDFVQIDFGSGYRPITDFNKPILYSKTIQNVVVRFLPDRIEGKSRFYGKQYLWLDINLYNNRKELIEYKKLDQIVVCPSDNSPRASFYDSRDCNQAEVSLNNLMTRKTQDLPDWSRIEIFVKTNSSRYNSVGFSQRLEIIQQRKSSFDIDVSFPAGLIIKKVGETGLGNLSGISTAIVGQWGFYRPDRIERFYPFKIGAGFIALNAFNFSENSNRDVGLVALGSVFPTKMSARFSFPLYLGFGYLLKDAKWFYILGPGIQVRF
ncbi:MAG TPA: hypothetical protein PKY12_02400 [Catalimonadaceae bacterium]|nr:hypothetical protein [Catalimonadaceae bacterium]